jgi:hypothetical protein
MAKDAGAWEPKVGERVWFGLHRIAGVHPSVPLTGVGVIVRDLRCNRAETYDYEVEVEGHGRLCFAREDLVTRWS